MFRSLKLSGHTAEDLPIVASTQTQTTQTQTTTTKATPNISHHAQKISVCFSEGS